MKRTKLGFTLVELLVVITIIGILMGLLIPAVNSARETARRNQCATNMKNLALAGVQYENTKGSMPGWVTKFGFFAGGVDPSDLGNFGGSVPAHVKVGGFGVTILPWLDAQPTYEHWTQDRYPIVNDGSGDLDATTGSSGDGFHELAAPNLAIFQCPSNPVSSGSHAKNSYVSNNGMSHLRTDIGSRGATGHDSSTPGTPVATYDGSQTKANGVFTAKYLGVSTSGSMMGTGPSIGLDDMKDGQGFTILFSENVQALPWHRPGFVAQGSPAATALAPVSGTEDVLTSPALLYSRFTNGMVWHYEDPRASDLNGLPTPPTSPSGASVTDVPRQHRINGGGTTVQDDVFNLQMTDNTFDAPSLARPSSAHIDGVNAAFADGATRFISDSVDYRVQQAVMTPRGKSSNVPWQEFVLTDELGQ
ncbi:hypothetical protein K227x_45200 [Rubripirellula lacrimiformis]|uniref:DUF1559 domain-containing protein n=1 Tax=Rubripirellula lacrimiformis TaxID=1930273 RepID=A0A517NGB2_9BACT|nr:DUF1559 domain-containing protein [Rubripirellula lacrimiformis]QDT06113.1 hypothetical protein K227x_45200 [Rubripirellula lacrimiformis]